MHYIPFFINHLSAFWYHPSTGALLGSRWAGSMDASLVFVNLVTSFFFVTFVIKAGRHFQKNKDKKKELEKEEEEEENVSKADSVKKQPAKEWRGALEKKI